MRVLKFLIKRGKNSKNFFLYMSCVAAKTIVPLTPTAYSKSI